MRRVVLRLCAALTVAGSGLAWQVVPIAATTNTNHKPPYADVVNGPMWGGVDPRGIATNATNWLSSMGYKAWNDNNNTDAPTAVGPAYAMDDSVFVVFGHGAPGQMAVEKNGVVSAITADYRMSLPSDWLSRGSGVRANLYQLPSGYWNRMKLAMWFGCNTGLNGDNTRPYGANLVTISTSYLGADSSIGYRYLLYYSPNQPDLYEDAFFHALYDYYGTPGTVQQAADAGVANVAFWWPTSGPTYYGFGNPYVVGGSVKVRPAAYGNP